MREILFRGKSTDTGAWVYGYYCGPFGCFDEHEICDIADPTCSRVDVDTETVGQYTGLTDNNGQRIFEGDIGRYKQTDGAKRDGEPIICTGKVVYNAKTASYAVEGKDEKGVKYFDYFPINDFEVIGNIHDNPELIGGTEDGK